MRTFKAIGILLITAAIVMPVEAEYKSNCSPIAANKSVHAQVEVVVGETIVLLCPYCQDIRLGRTFFTWQFQSREITINNHSFYDRVVVQEEDDSYDIKLVDLMKEDVGNYACKIYEQDKGDIYSFYWNLVLRPLTPIYMLITPSSLRVPENTNFQLNCQVIGSATNFELTWLWKTANKWITVDSALTYDLKTGRTGTTMTFKASDFDMEFMCATFSPNETKIERKILVHVTKEIPPKTKESFQILDVSLVSTGYEEIVLNWTIVHSMVSTAGLKFIVTYKLFSDSSLDSTNSTNELENEFLCLNVTNSCIVTGLTKNTTYVFYVTALMDKFISQPSLEVVASTMVHPIEGRTITNVVDNITQTEKQIRSTDYQLENFIGAKVLVVVGIIVVVILFCCTWVSLFMYPDLKVGNMLAILSSPWSSTQAPVIQV